MQHAVAILGGRVAGLSAAHEFTERGFSVHNNLFLASDYVRTYTDIACMEAANEAGRRAVNCLLLACGSSAPPAGLWPLEEPDFLKPLQEIDHIRFALGRPHTRVSSERR